MGIHGTSVEAGGQLGDVEVLRFSSFLVLFSKDHGVFVLFGVFWVLFFGVC